MALRFLNHRPHTLQNLLSTVVTRTSLVECWIPETSLSTLRTSELLTLQRENLPANDTRSQDCIVPRPPPPGRASPLPSPGAASCTESPLKFPQAIDTQARGRSRQTQYFAAPLLELRLLPPCPRAPDATALQSSVAASCSSRCNRRSWSAGSAAMRLASAAAGSLASIRRRFWVLRARIRPSVSILTPHFPVLRSCGSTISAWRPLSSGARCSEWSFILAPTTSCNPPSASGGVVGMQSSQCHRLVAVVRHVVIGARLSTP